jgi:hypothetical protein
MRRHQRNTLFRAAKLARSVSNTRMTCHYTDIRADQASMRGDAGIGSNRMLSLELEHRPVLENRVHFSLTML